MTYNLGNMKEVQRIVLTRGVDSILVNPKTKRCKVVLKGGKASFEGTLKEAIEWLEGSRRGK